MFQISPDSEKAIKILESHGYEAYLAGGCVRDLAMGKVPHDWDITTAAEPEETKRLFRNIGCRVIETGITHGTVTVILGKELLEITTFRSEAAYSDHRRPDRVTFVKTAREDVQRRDFTVNGLLYHPAVGILDYVNGLQDIHAKCLRCIGDPEERFREDALRILRGLRFSAVLGFQIETETGDAMTKNRFLLQDISQERKQEELNKLLLGKNAKAVLSRYPEIMAAVIPPIGTMVGYDQNNPHHCYDLWTHTVEAVAAAPEILSVRLAMLLHDIGKPLCRTTDDNGISHFYDHPRHSAALSKEILHSLRYSNGIIQTVTTLIEYHNLPLSATGKSIRRVLNRIGEENLRLLLAVKKADLAAKSDYRKGEKQQLLKAAASVLQQVLSERQCFCLNDLAVNGTDLLAAGVPQGKEIGCLLNLLLEQVIDGQLPNDHSVLLDFAKKQMRTVNSGKACTD